MAQKGSVGTNGVTEDEAALYDRQIRLWGLEAQGRIRTAHVLVLNLDGLTTEAIKNWVLAGIHRLTLVDFRDRTEPHDLSAGFFWREEDVGNDRLSTAAARIQALNPLVKIDVLPAGVLRDILDPSSSKLADLMPNVLVVGVPSGPQGLSSAWGRDSLCQLSDRAHQLGTPFYCAGTQGLNGWVFSDLGERHEYVIERPELNTPLPASTVEGAATGASAPPFKDAPAGPSSASLPTSTKRLEKRRQAFVPLRKALDQSWKGFTRAQLRRQRPSLGYFGVLATWACAADDEGATPTAAQVAAKAQTIMEQRGIDPATLSTNDDADAFFDALSLSLSQSGEFSPTCAMLGGVLSQDVLNAIGGREEPLVNWFQLEGLTGSGPVHALSVVPSTVVPPLA